ncbi:MAG: LysR substrate-binding domain-containing protein, partial [Octadecabacter sp.]|nr:LysR substrate-binding domain-containing protein [Octadecabacter sp.]
GLVEALRRNEIDRIVGILRGQACPDGLKEDFLYNERFVVIARKGHPLHVEVPGIDALEQTNWVVAPHGTPVRSYFETVFSDIGASPPTQTCELLSFGYAEQMLEVSNSAAVLTYSDRKLATLRSELAEVRTGFPEQTAQIGVSSLKTAPTNRALNEFDRVLKRLVLEQNHVD